MSTLRQELAQLRREVEAATGGGNLDRVRLYRLLDRLPDALLERALEVGRSYRMEAFSRAELERVRPRLGPQDVADLEEFLSRLEGTWHPAQQPPVVRLPRDAVVRLGEELDFVNAPRWAELPGGELAVRVRHLAEAAKDGDQARTPQMADLLEEIVRAVGDGAVFEFDEAPALPAPAVQQPPHKEAQ
jgi:hypothetical protein